MYNNGLTFRVFANVQKETSIPATEFSYDRKIAPMPIRAVHFIYASFIYHNGILEGVRNHRLRSGLEGRRRTKFKGGFPTVGLSWSGHQAPTARLHMIILVVGGPLMKKAFISEKTRDGSVRAA